MPEAAEEHQPPSSNSSPPMPTKPKVPQKARPPMFASKGASPPSKARPTTAKVQSKPQPPTTGQPQSKPQPPATPQPQPRPSQQPPTSPPPPPPVQIPHRPPHPSVPPQPSAATVPPQRPPPPPCAPSPPPPNGPPGSSPHPVGQQPPPPPSSPPPTTSSSDAFKPPPRQPAATSAAFSKNAAAAAASGTHAAPPPLNGARSKHGGVYVPGNRVGFGASTVLPTCESRIPVGIPDPTPPAAPSQEMGSRDHLALNQKAVATGRALKEGDYCSITKQGLDELRHHLQYFMTFEADNEPSVIMASYDRTAVANQPHEESGDTGSGNTAASATESTSAGTSTDTNIDTNTTEPSTCAPSSSPSSASSMLLDPAWVDGAMAARALMARRRVAQQRPGSKEEVVLQQIRFSQESISSVFQDGRRVSMMMEELRKKEKRVTDIPSISVVVEDGKIYSGDHRRLSVFKQTFHGHTMVPVNVGIFDQAFKRKMTSTTEGRSIRSRN